MAKRFTYVCHECGSSEVVMDAWACWDVDEQDWVLRNTSDLAFCDRCDAETGLAEVELRPHRDLAA